LNMFSMDRRNVLVGLVCACLGFIGGCSIFDEGSETIEMLVFNMDDSPHTARVGLEYGSERDSITKSYQIDPNRKDESDVPVRRLNTIEFSVDETITKEFRFEDGSTCNDIILHISSIDGDRPTDDDIGMNDMCQN